MVGKHMHILFIQKISAYMFLNQSIPNDISSYLQTFDKLNAVFNSKVCVDQFTQVQILLEKNGAGHKSECCKKETNHDEEEEGD